MLDKRCIAYFMVFILINFCEISLLSAQQGSQKQSKQFSSQQQTEDASQPEKKAEPAAQSENKESKQILKDLTLPSSTLEIKRLEAKEPVYSIELRDVNLSDFFRVAAHDYNLNIFVDKDVTGTISASFTNISLEEAIERIAESNDLALIKKKNIINVVPNLITKTFVLKYLRAKKILGESEEEDISIKESVSSGTAAAASETAKKTANTIYDLLSGKGKIFFEDAPNSIVVIDYPKNIELISEYLSKIDVRPYQVLIEARVVEVKLEKESSLGVNWQAFAKNHGMKIGQYRLYSQAGGALQQQINYKSTYYPPGQSSAETSAEDPFTVTIFDENISIVLRMLADSLKTNILSAPKITTINNHKANIKMTQKIPWAEPEVDTSAESGVVSVTWNANFEEVGINLEVTPTIDDQGNITMLLNPDISECNSYYNLTVTQGTAEIPYTIPIIDTRTASTKVIVGNGQTLILGGLIKNKTVEGETKVPFLGDIPFLGYLFKSKKDTGDKTELLIFVSPTIITNEVYTNMAMQERHGIGREFVIERERQEQILKTMALQEQHIELQRQKEQK